MRIAGPRVSTLVFALALPWMLPALVMAKTPPTATNAECPEEFVSYNPDNGDDIVIPSGFKVSVFVKDLNFPTGIAFRGDSEKFEVYVLESGHGLPSRCNDETKFPGPPTTNPFTPDILVFDQRGKLIRGPLGKPPDPVTTTPGSFQPHGPAVDIAFERGNVEDRKSTRLNSSHTVISYAVFCLKKKNKLQTRRQNLGHTPHKSHSPLVQDAVASLA